MNLLESEKYIVGKDVEALLGVSSATATRVLFKMLDERMIKRSGAGRTIKYSL